MTFDPVKDMNAIDGVISYLASRTGRPQGYPFSKITIYSVNPDISKFMPEYEHKAASCLKEMRKLDFKKAGKIFGKETQKMKDNLDSVPEEYIIISDRFDVIDEPKRKATGCRQYMVEVETEDCPELWEAICFKKSVKEYVTENLMLNINPCVFGDKYPDKNHEVIPRVWCHFIDGPESLYESLEIHGERVFSDTPIRLRLRTRKEIHDGYMPAGVRAEIDGCRIAIYWDGQPTGRQCR